MRSAIRQDDVSSIEPPPRRAASRRSIPPSNISEILLMNAISHS
jgi:hypothetical protein